ncbi:transcriptional repressor [Spirochaetota bacterium]
MQGDELRILEGYLRGKGLKLTKARQIVLMAFLGLEEHVNADMVYEAAKQIDPGIGQATVFRTLRLLEDAGLAREASRENGTRRYEHAYNHAHHDHLRCIACGSIIEFSDSSIERAQDAVFRRYGFTPKGHRMDLFGLCPACNNKSEH